MKSLVLTALVIVSCAVYANKSQNNHKKGRLLVSCTIRHESQVVQWLGYEYVQKSNSRELFVEFAAYLAYVPQNDCDYMENPMQVSENPNEYFDKFQPSMTKSQYIKWATTSH